MDKSVEQLSTRLKVTEIFYSLQGEAYNMGRPTVFIRLTGCPLRCRYCDTEYAFSGGTWLSLAAIITEVKKYNTPHITLTGGEPLAQKNSLLLLKQLADLFYDVSIETSGALPIDAIDKRVVKVVDVKTPSSHESDKNLQQNYQYLSERDQLKFVISDELDYQWSCDQLETKLSDTKAEILFSPNHQQLSAEQLAQWILRDQLSVRLQIQLHKYLWGDKKGV